MEDIYNAKFKEAPSGYQQLSAKDIEGVKSDPASSNILPGQEKGIRSSIALPYELYANSRINADKKIVEIKMEAGNTIFGKQSAGTPFIVYAPGKFTDGKGVAENARNWSFAVSAGDSVTYSWPVEAFENKLYHLRLYGPNGFYREFAGNEADPLLEANCRHETETRNKKPTGNIVLTITNAEPLKPLHIEIKDNAYGKKSIKKVLAKAGDESIVLNLKSSYGWYDFSIKVAGFDDFEKRYAGRVETGKESFTDPFMGRVTG